MTVSELIKALQTIGENHGDDIDVTFEYYDDSESRDFKSDINEVLVATNTQRYNTRNIAILR